jgi:hypothetical protein
MDPFINGSIQKWIIPWTDVRDHDSHLRSFLHPQSPLDLPALSRIRPQVLRLPDPLRTLSVLDQSVSDPRIMSWIHCNCIRSDEFAWICLAVSKSVKKHSDLLNLLKLVQTCSHLLKLFQFCLYLFRSVQNVSNPFNLESVQTWICSNLFKTVQTCSNLFQSVPTGSTLFELQLC